MLSRRWAVLILVVWLTTPAFRLGCAWSCASATAPSSTHAMTMSCHDSMTTDSPVVRGVARCADQPVVSLAAPAPTKAQGDLAFAVAPASTFGMGEPRTMPKVLVVETRPPDRPTLAVLRL